MELKRGNNRIYAENQEGKVIAEITFPLVEEGICEIDHTIVDASLRGQGVADKLVQAAATAIKQDKLKAKVSCSYAQKWFAKHQEQADILVKQKPTF